MASRVFAVVVGIDQYKSGDVWDLQSCVSDARGIKHWLTDDLNVPKNQVASLLNEQATLQSIETTLRSHLLENDRVQRGDAILIYFAGHGSTVRTPDDWVVGGAKAAARVEVLCPYDHETRTTDGRVAGISARAMHAFLRELSAKKGSNITLMLDSSFAPTQSRDRGRTRWTSSNKAVPEDLYCGAFSAEKGQRLHESFYDHNSSTHILIAACKAGCTAIEGKEGGRFTSFFLETVRSLPLHSTSFRALMDHISRKMGDIQQPIFTDHDAVQFFLNAIPFVEDARFVPVLHHADGSLKLQVGSFHGIVTGGQLSLHNHNYAGSRNPPIANAIIQDVHLTWCIVTVRSKSRYTLLPNSCWARIDQHRALASVVKASCAAILQKVIHHKRSSSVSNPVSTAPSRTSSMEKLPVEISQNEVTPAGMILANL